MATATQNLSAAAQAVFVRRLKAGDEDVLHDILQSFGGLVMHNLRAALPVLNDADLEEILGEALFRLWNSRASYVPAKGSLLNWFLHIARNAAIDSMRLNWQQIRALEQPFAATDAQIPERLSSVETESSRVHDDLMEVLATLGEKDRCIIHAYACSRGAGHWTHPLVEELGMSAGAIRTRAHRILSRLRQEMQDRGYEVGDLSREVIDRDQWLRA